MVSLEFVFERGRKNSCADDSPALAVVDLVAASVEHSQFEAAASSSVTRLATQLGCERVSLGFVRGNHVEVRTMSGIATMNSKMRLTRTIARSMDEAIGQDTTIVYPTNDKKSFFATRCHEELLKMAGSGSNCTIPISRDGVLIGAATFEHENECAMDRSTVANLIRLLELPNPVQQALRNHKISAGHARALLPLGEESEQTAFCKRIQSENLSVRATEKLVTEPIREADADPLQGISNEGTPHKSPTPRDQHLASLELELRTALGTRVGISQSSKGRGKIIIHFASHEEFDRIRAFLNGQHISSADAA